MSVVTMNVSHPTGSYPIVVGSGVYDPSTSSGYAFSSPYVVVTDENVAPLYSQRFGDAVAVITLKAGEAEKNLGTVRTIYERLVAEGLGRDTTLIALGGGVIGDMTGFVAATYLRGVKFIQCPTTLLSMVDASVGGKTGVDLPEGKNLVGAFKQPEAVLVDIDTLDTLPDDEFASGMAEVIKHGIIGDPEMFEMLEQGQLTHNRAELVARAIEVKRKIVEKDPFETEGLRALLNLGHTFGHAVEQASQYKIKHGYGVAMGTVVAGRISAELGHCSGSLLERIEEIFPLHNLPTRIPQNLNVDDCIRIMQTDKKKKGGKVRYILPRALGDCFMTADVPTDLIRKTMLTCMTAPNI